MENMKFNIDANEPKIRNICLLLHGIPESNDESTDNITLDTIQNEVRVSISLEDIERTHHVGPRKRPIKGQRTKHRAIIVRFASMRKRMEVYANKKNLKEKNIFVSESLTIMRLNLLRQAEVKFARKTFGLQKVKYLPEIIIKLF